MNKIFFVLLLVLFNISFAGERDKTITTSASSVIYAAADKATLSFGVESIAENIRSVRKKNSQIVKKIFNSIRALKIPNLVITSENINVHIIKESSYEARKDQRIPEILGYKIIQNISVLLKNNNVAMLSKNTSSVIDTALQNGVNIMSSGVSFSKDGIEKIKNKAIKQATITAMKRVQLIAKTANLKIKSYQNINTNSSSYSPFAFRNRNSVSSNVVMDAVRSSTPVSTSTTINASKIAIKAQVSLQAILK
jgi:uncharacterized protein